jgi:hypothetical protein
VYLQGHLLGLEVSKNRWPTYRRASERNSWKRKWVERSGVKDGLGSLLREPHLSDEVGDERISISANAWLMDC